MSDLENKIRYIVGAGLISDGQIEEIKQAFEEEGWVEPKLAERAAEIE